MSKAAIKDYSLIGEDSLSAVQKGLAEAEWYQCPVPRDQMRELLKRRDWPAVRDTLIWFALLGSSGYAAYSLWGTWWCIIPFMIYGLIYASSSDSRWHESSHGTAFKTDWLNNALYEIASFMVMRESTPWRWSHTRHHSDTIIVGRDPEIAVPRPPDIKAMIFGFFNLRAGPSYFSTLFLHSINRLSEEEKTYIPEEEAQKVYFKAKIHLLIYFSIIALAIYTGSFLPLMFIGLPNLYGAWLMPIYGYTQHAGLAENVLDHRLNCRTVKMNFIHRYLYWNMNYHVEHHMFPLVPYHALPKLYEIVKDDMPKPYNSIWEAYKEIIPTVIRQIKDPGYFVKRELPKATKSASAEKIISFDTSKPISDSLDGWIQVCAKDEIPLEDVIRFDFENRTYAVYRTAEDKYYATDGMCTHGKKHLAEGLVIGNQIECPKHNGRFDITDGSPKRAPICIGLKTYEVKVQDDFIFINLQNQVANTSKDQCENHIVPALKKVKVVSNKNVATFIKELVLEPIEGLDPISYKAGDYIQIKIPEYDEISFQDFVIDEPYRSVWEAHHVFDNKASNPSEASRNYSMASNPDLDKQMRFNVRIATPPRGQACDAGIGSSYVFNLKEGDVVEIMDPEGDFHVKDTDKEMIYIGGGAGMAPLRSHISYLFETFSTDRKVSFWYGARSKQELFYDDYFESIAEKNENFSFNTALSEALKEDEWNGYEGFIHDVLRKEYLESHPDPKAVEYYLCGPPAMIQAAKKMLVEEFEVSEENIAFDEF